MEKITIEELMEIVDKTLELYTSEYYALKANFEALLKTKSINN